MKLPMLTTGSCTQMDGGGGRQQNFIFDQRIELWKYFIKLPDNGPRGTHSFFFIQTTSSNLLWSALYTEDKVEFIIQISILFIHHISTICTFFSHIIVTVSPVVFFVQRFFVTKLTHWRRQRRVNKEGGGELVEVLHQWHFLLLVKCLSPFKSIIYS